MGKSVADGGTDSSLMKNGSTNCEHVVSAGTLENGLSKDGDKGKVAEASEGTSAKGTKEKPKMISTWQLVGNQLDYCDAT